MCTPPAERPLSAISNDNFYLSFHKIFLSTPYSVFLIHDINRVIENTKLRDEFNHYKHKVL